MRKTTKTIGIFLALTLGYHYLSPRIASDIGGLLLTISSFLFATFTGFFMSRQSDRYSAIRGHIADFDGGLTAIYRDFGHLSGDLQASAAAVIRRHYEAIVKHRAWDWHFVNKSNTLTSLHGVLDETVPLDTGATVRSKAVENVLETLNRLQAVRKNMVTLHVERVPLFQWALIYILAVILLTSISGIPSSIFGSILKGAFGTSAILVLMLLHDFDGLKFFEGAIGTSSAQDVLGILEGRK